MSASPPRRALLVLPQFEISSRDFERCVRSIAVNFGAEVHVSVCAPREWAQKHQKLGTSVEEYRRDAAERFDRVAFIEKGKPAESLALGKVIPGRVFRFDFTYTFFRARLLSVGHAEDSTMFPQFDSQIFSKLAPNGSDFYYFFPYGYLFRCLGLGPLNDFGFRHVPYEDLVDRSPQHKVIAFFGGSACWSLDCLTPEMHTSRLEEKLNGWSKGQGSPLTFSVLNCGQHGHVVLNEMLTYQLFLNAKRPVDMVIGHDGFNDLVYGMFADPALVARKIVYQDNLEDWSRLLHGTSAKPPRFSGVPYPIVNTPARIVESYVARKQQFQRVVNADGALFVWGLQPYIGYKPNLSPLEAEFFSETEGIDKYTDGQNNMKLVYQMVEQIPTKLDVDFVNVAAAITALGKDFSFFVDRVHPTPEGDDFIADVYFRHIVKGISGGRYFK